jgi:hypothetical protein
MYYFLSNTRVGGYVVTQDCKVTFASPAFLHCVGKPIAEVLRLARSQGFTQGLVGETKDAPARPLSELLRSL